MICKVCGKTLNEGDRFCSGCGSRVLETEFFGSRQQEQENEQSRTVSHEEFDWNLDGYPSESSKRNEDFEFDWKSVTSDHRNRNIGADERLDWKTDVADVPKTETYEPVSLEDLFDSPSEESSYGTDEPTRQYKDSKTVKLDKFYTFNKKNEEFQALLDREYEKMQAGGTAGTDEGLSRDTVVFHEQESAEAAQPEAEIASEPAAENMTFEEAEAETVPEAETESEPEVETVPEIESEPAVEVIEEEPAPENKLPSFNDVESGLVGVVLAETPAGVMATSDPNSKEEEKSEAVPPERKLTFEDVFSDEDEDEEGGPKKKGRVLRVIAVILCILIVLELVMIAVQYFAPETALAQKFNEVYLYIVNKITSIV